MTGILCETQMSSGLLAKKFKTSVCDCMLMRTDSAEVMHPLQEYEVNCTFFVPQVKCDEPARKTVIQANFSRLQLLLGIRAKFQVIGRNLVV